MNEKPNHPVAGPYQVFMLGLCIIVLIALAFETLFDLSQPTRTILAYVDTGICVLFLADFFVNLIRAQNKLRFLKFGWIDLLSSIPTVEALRVGRLARVIRIVRVLRGVRSTRMLMAYALKKRTESALLTAVLVSILLVLFSSIAILHVETSDDANIRTAQDSLWWSVVTITTVGYGDRFPITPEGRILAALLMVAGIGLFGTFTGFVAAWFVVPGNTDTTAKPEPVVQHRAEGRMSPDIGFSIDALRQRDALNHAFNVHLGQLVQERAASNDRPVVTDEDIRACAGRAFDLTLVEG